MADTWFFDDCILTHEARALVKAAAGRSVHSQPVHDCRILLLSDNLSIVLCFNRGRSRDFRVLPSSTAVKGAAENMTAQMMLPRAS